MFTMCLWYLLLYPMSVSIVEMKRLGRILAIYYWFVITGLIASFIMITTVNILPPAKGVISMETPEDVKLLCSRSNC